MKYRTGFVSNSSSSSFIAATSKLTEDEILALLEYATGPENTDHWSIELDEDKGLVTGYTSMDNGAFPE